MSKVRFVSGDGERTEVVDLDGPAGIPGWAESVEAIEDPGGVIPLDRSLYPKHVPTLREQAEVSAWDLEDMNTAEAVRNGSAIGVVVDPTTRRNHYDDEYEADSIADRMAAHGTSQGSRVHTVAGTLGPDHDQTVFPSALED